MAGPAGIRKFVGDAPEQQVALGPAAMNIADCVEAFVLCAAQAHCPCRSGLGSPQARKREQAWNILLIPTLSPFTESDDVTWGGHR